MAAETHIEWCDSTFNPWIGCTRVSPACDDCYAARSTPARTLGVVWGPHEERRRTSTDNWKLPERWERQHQAFHAKHGRRRRVFCASLADVFDNAVPVQWRRDLFDLIAATPNLDWLLLTKRIGNARSLYGEAYLDSARSWPANVWIGATVVTQAEADRDIPKLLATPAAVRFLSIEPMLEPIDLRVIDVDGDREIYPLRTTTGCVDEDGDEAPDVPALDWVICGGESGPHARPMHPDWTRRLRDQCAAAGVPFMFKQWGEWLPISEIAEEYMTRLYRSRVKAKPHEDQSALDESFGRTCIVESSVVWHDGSVHELREPMAFQDTGSMQTFKVGKKAAGRLLDGRTHDGFPVGRA